MIYLVLLFNTINIQIDEIKPLITDLKSDWYVVASWSWDGKGILFNGKYGNDEKDNLYYYSLAKDKIIPVLITYYEKTAPIITREGDKIYFHGYDKNREAYDIFVYDIKKDIVSKLVSKGHQIAFPCPSPDGQFIYFQRENDDKVSHIFRVRNDGEFLKEMIKGDFRETYHVAISPDGRYLAYTSFLINDEGKITDTSEIFLYDIEKGSEKQLTHNKYSKYGISFSPDGKYILYYSYPEGEIYILSVLTKEIKQLTFNSFSDKFPRFSPDGQKIIFTRVNDEDDDDAPQHLYIAYLSGNDLPKSISISGYQNLFSQDKGLKKIPLNTTNKLKGSKKKSLSICYLFFTTTIIVLLVVFLLIFVFKKILRKKDKPPFNDITDVEV